LIKEFVPAYPAHLVDTFRKKTPKSRAEYHQTAEILPAGSPGGLGCDAIAGYQVYIERAEGCYIWDVDGNRYLDMFCGDWLQTLGHGNPQIKAAITAQLDKGTTFGCFPAKLGYELASLMRERIPSVEMLRYATSGTEANLNAFRLARTFTKRGKIAKFHGAYHGSADVTIMSNCLNGPDSIPPGMFPGTERGVVLLPPNDIAACEKIIERERDELAAILFEPIMGVMGFVPLTHEFVRFLREITQKHGIVLICDEVVTMPLDVGGAQGYYGITPDLTTFGKAIGGGLPLAAYGGRRDIMGLLDPHQHEGRAPLLIAATMGGMPICLAAGLAAVKQYTPEMHRHLHLLGDRARDGFRALAKKYNVPLQVTGVGQFTGLHWAPTKVVDFPSYTTNDYFKMMTFWFAMAVRGFMGAGLGTFLVSAPMTTADIDELLVAAEQALHDCEFIK